MGLVDQISKDARSLYEAEFSEPITFPELEFDTRAVFDESFEQIDPATGAVVLSDNPRIGIGIKEIEAKLCKKIEIGWLVIARDVQFRIHKIEPDGHGAAAIILKRVN